MLNKSGYDPNDSESRRVMKASCFVKSMIKKGQSSDNAFRIASSYYHVSEKKVRAYEENAYDDDTYFFVNGAIPVAASEMFDSGDFC